MAGRAIDRMTGPADPPFVAVVVRFVLGVILAAFAINAIGYVVEAGTPVAGIAAAVACLLALLAVQLMLAEPRVQRSRWAPALLAAQALLVYVPLVFFQSAWTGMFAFVAGSALLVLRPAVGWPAFTAVTASAAVAQVFILDDPITIAYIAANSVAVGLVVYGLSRLRSLITDLHDTRTALAAAAITRQRLQFATDLRDLLGGRLTGITVKTELGRRLLPAAPAEALREIGEVIEIARDALADVRSIASSYREISFDDEIASVRSALTAAGVAVTLRRDRGELPPAVGTALAATLRDAATTVLRHSAARRCTIALTIGGGSATLEIGTDVPDDSQADIHDLALRIAALDGTLTAGPTRLLAQIPVPATAPATRRTPPEPAERAIAPTVAQAIVAGFAATFLVVRVVFVLYAGLSPVGSIVAIGSAAACVLLQFVIIRAPEAAAARALLLSQAVLAFLPIVLYHDETLGAVGVVAGSALLVLRPRVGVAAFGALAVFSAVLGWLYDGSWLGISYPLLVTINHGLEWAALLFLHGLVTSLHAARTERAVLAVMKERLRFARDLHDLLGYSMSAITLKAELARRLVDLDAQRADAELAEIAGVARKALAEIRAIARSPQALSLDEQIASARTLLAAADIAVTVTVRVDDGELPGDVRTVLATMLREGITNVLRHSKAEHCTITLARAGAAVSLEIVNDGTAATRRGAGTGIRNLAARVEELGGHLSAGATADNAFRLHADVPLMRQQEPVR